MSKTLNVKSIEQLQDEVAMLEEKVQTADVQVQTIRSHMRDLQKQISQRIEIIGALKKLARMSDGERAALAQLISGAGNIKSQESIDGLSVQKT